MLNRPCSGKARIHPPALWCSNGRNATSLAIIRISWRTLNDYRRLTADAHRPAWLEVYEPEACVARRIFDDYVTGERSTRQIARRLAANEIASPSGKRMWATSTISRLLRNEAYVGRVYYNQTETVSASAEHKRPTRQRPRPRQDWILNTVPPPSPTTSSYAAGQVSHDHSQWPSQHRTGQWLLRGLVTCGRCDVGTNCQKMRGRNDTVHRYYYCRNHDVIHADGPDRRCTERHIRAVELDAFVFDQIRVTLAHPEMLLAGDLVRPPETLLSAQPQTHRPPNRRSHCPSTVHDIDSDRIRPLQC